MATPHVASSQKANYLNVPRKEYEIAQVNGQRRLSEIPKIFDIVDFLSEEYGLIAYYRHNRTIEEKHGRGEIRTLSGMSIERFGPDIRPVVIGDVSGIVLYDSKPESGGIQPSAPHEALFTCLPLMYIKGNGEFVLEVPQYPCLNNTYKRKFWPDLGDKIAEILQSD